MRGLCFKKIDAFATEESAGNPAGFIFLERDAELSDMDMLKIAKELKGFVSEVGYATKIAPDKVKLRYFSSEKEVEFCGHATVAIMYDLLKEDAELAKCATVEIATNRGKLSVENNIASDDCVFVRAPEPIKKQNTLSIDMIAEQLGIEVGDIKIDLPVEIIDAGLRTLIIPMYSLEKVLAVDPDIEVLNNFCRGHEIDIIEIFTQEVANPKNDYRTRVFAATFGYLEDPATGSGNSAFGYYLIWHNKWTDEKVLVIEQSKYEKEYNIVKLKKRKDAQSEWKVYFGGKGITKIDGTYKLYSKI